VAATPGLSAMGALEQLGIVPVDYSVLRTLFAEYHPDHRAKEYLLNLQRHIDVPE
jgi:hypothetical protein